MNKTRRHYLIFSMLVLTFLFLFTGCGSSKVELSTMIDVSFSGANGKGNASIDFDRDKLNQEIKASSAGEKITKRKREELVSTFSCELDKNSALKNGDTITVTVDWDESLAEEYHLKFTGAEISVKVEGLKELKEIDAFSDIIINYTGVSPQLEAEVINNSNINFLKMATYQLSESYNLQAGDSITVTVSYSEDLAESEGYTVKEAEKTYTVEAVDEYATQYEQITEDALQKMQAQAQDLIEAELSTRDGYADLMYQAVEIDSLDYGWGWDGFDAVVNGGVKCSKAFLLTNKDMRNAGYYDNYNLFYLIYEVILSDDQLTTPTTIYIPIEFNNLIVREDGTLDVTVTDGSITDSCSSVCDNMYRDTVTAQKDSYNVEEVSLETAE